MSSKRAESKARIDDVFTKFLDRQQEVAKKQAEAYQKGGQPEFNLHKDVDLSKIDELHKPEFDRDKLNDQYLDVTKGETAEQAVGTVGDTTAIKQQIAVLAGAERAFRTRHCSPTRALSHMHSRKLGHSEGGVFPTIRTCVEDTIRAGGLTPKEQKDAF